MKPEQNEAIKIAFYKGIQGGTSGAMAMAIQVNCGTLMYLFQIPTGAHWAKMGLDFPFWWTYQNAFFMILDYC